MRLLNRIKAIFASGRTITGKLQHEEEFWTEVQRAAFLLRNLKDDDINWGQPHYYLRRVDHALNAPDEPGLAAELEAVHNLYLAWIAIAVQIDEFQNYEIDPWWLYKVDAAAAHIFDRVLPRLTQDAQSNFAQNMPAMHKACNEKVNINMEGRAWINF